jgi:hypothetical protein
VTQPTHAELKDDIKKVYIELGATSQQIENLEVRASGHDDRLQVIQAQVDHNARMSEAVLHALNEMREDIAAIKDKVFAWEMFKARVIWVTSTIAGAFSVAAAFLWWLVGDKVAHFFKGAPPSP